MIVDFQHHFMPRELLKKSPGESQLALYDEHGSPRFTENPLLDDLDEHIRMMDEAGIDVAMLTCRAGMCGPLEPSRFVNDKAKQAERDYPGRFLGMAHAHPLGGREAFHEIARCAGDLGFPGVVIASEVEGLLLDAPELEPFWTEAERLNLFVFVHPAGAFNYGTLFDRYDLGRSLGREFSLLMATVRLINGGVFDRHPNLTVDMSHLGGGLAGMLGRIRSFQDKEFWGTAGNSRHGARPARDFDSYIRTNMFFDCAGSSGAISAVKAGLIEIPASRIVFASDYPQDIRARGAVKNFVQEIRALGSDGEAILSGSCRQLLQGRMKTGVAA